MQAVNDAGLQETGNRRGASFDENPPETPTIKCTNDLFAAHLAASPCQGDRLDTIGRVDFASGNNDPAYAFRGKATGGCRNPARGVDKDARRIAPLHTIHGER